jgi:CAAX protease family protein
VGLTEPAHRRGDVYVFLVLACLVTWALDVPMARAMLAGREPGPTALALAGLGAFGPTLAALLVAGRRRELGDVFGRWRTRPIWILVALGTMPALHLPATLIEVALGGSPAQWFYPPAAPEHVAGLVMFSVGEEFGWRGFAYPRLAEQHGAVIGCVILGLVWTVWHLGMWFTPGGPPSLAAVSMGAGEIVAGTLVFAWVFERGSRSMAVAIALHASAHLDNVFRAPESEVRLRLLRLGVLAAAAVLAARSLRSSARVAVAVA